MSGDRGLVLPRLDGGGTPWCGLDRMPQRPDEFSFVLLSDRTGAARPGVFERGIDVINLLRPDFVIQIGDQIQGYTSDPAELATQWAEVDAIVGRLEVPLFRLPGNHDVSNEVMRAEWLRRHGALHYAFRFHDVLFCMLDTQDPPPEPADEPWDEPDFDWNGTMPARISDEQVAWAEGVIAEHADARWAVLCMHMPAWQGKGHPGLDRIRRALGDRPYTAFAGHVHNYQRTVLSGRDHVRLGPTGGCWVLDGEDGNFDHVAWITMTAHGPRLANIVLDGVLGIADGTFRAGAGPQTRPA